MLVLLSSMVSAYNSVFVRDSLYEGDAKAYETDNGIYIVELLLASGNTAKFKINNHVMKTMNEEGTDSLADDSQIVVMHILSDGINDQADYYFYGSGKDPIDANIDVNWDIGNCNFDGDCGDTEDKVMCCYDCGCEGGSRCEKNICIKQVGCERDSDCNDNNPCSDDVCMESRCVYSERSGCVLDGVCFDYGAVEMMDEIGKYCTAEGWKKQKEAKEECAENYECINNKCIEGKCYVKSSRWFFILIVLGVVVGLILYGGRKGQFIRKVKKKLFWKF